MVKPRPVVLVSSAGALLAAVWLLWPRTPASPGGSGAGAARRGRAGAGPAELPRIDLARLDGLAERPTVEPGKRAVSDYPPPPQQVADSAPVPVVTPAGPPLPAPINISYLGSLESAAGLKVAVFITQDKNKTVLHGREGEVVGSRVRVVKIGLESVDVEDLASGRNQRLALPKRGGSGAGAGAGAGRDARDKARGG
jgi:hypothetical protein